jgi:carbon-monoxide dehydrogenase small subunit
MKLEFLLNGERAVIEAAPNERLSFLLRDKLRLPRARCGCGEGRCGVCAVIYNGRLSAACLIPAFSMEKSTIVTIEGFCKSDNYADIAAAFDSVPVRNCDFCAGAKILAAESLISSGKTLSRKDILDVFSAIKCRCDNPDTIVEGVLAAADLRKQRLASKNSAAGAYYTLSRWSRNR